MNNELLDRLEGIPAFTSLEQSFRKNFNPKNFYFAHFMPETQNFRYEKNRGIPEAGAGEQIAARMLLEDDSGYFSEFVHEDNLRTEVTEFIRFIFKELYND